MAGNTTGISLSGFVGGVIGGAAVATAVHLLGRRGGVSPSRSRQIIRIGTTDPRSSSVVIRDGLVTLSGQVAEIDKLAESDSELATPVHSLKSHTTTVRPLSCASCTPHCTVVVPSHNGMAYLGPLPRCGDCGCVA